MKKDDYFFSKEDIEEIFGEKILLNEKKLEEAARDEIKEISKSIIINKSKFAELERYSAQNKSENRDSIKVADNSVSKINENLTKSSKEEINDVLSFPDFMEESVIINIFQLNEEIRWIIEKELTEIIPKRTILNMLLRTLEKIAINYLILRGTNFTINGKIRDNGSIDTERLIQNIEKYKTQIMEIDKEIENALKSLFNMRMNAIKSGLGQQHYENIKENILKNLNVIKAGYKSKIFNFFKNKILSEIYYKEDV